MYLVISARERCQHFCSRSSLRPVNTRQAPIRLHSIAVVRPIPDDAPVTRIRLNQLSVVFKSNFNNENTDKLISIRNRIVHGYSSIRDDIIYTTLKNNLPSFIEKLNEFSRGHYQESLKQLLGKKITVYIDRPAGHVHDNVIYPINYGYTESLTALDGEFQDVYIIDTKEPLNEVSGTVVAIIHREDDIEDKLVVSLSNGDISENEIEEAIFFQEQYFKHTIVKLK